MPVHVTEENLVQWITEFLRANYENLDEAHNFALRSPNEGINLQLATSKVQSILEILSNKEERNETTLFDGKMYENLVREESRFGLPLFRAERNQIIKEDLDNGLTYRISPPSDEYLVFLLAKINDIGSVSMLRSPIMMDRFRRSQERIQENNDVLEAIKIITPRILTVRVESKKTRNYQEMSRHANAFLFQLTYNLDVSVVESRYLDDLLRSSRVISGRRSRLEDIEAPKRLYIPDIVYHYQMGVATDSPSHEYLSFYHVAEHFFEEVYNDELINNVRDRITQPAFSYRRKKDIQDLIKEINKRLKIRDESMIFNEQDALKLTIQRYINFDELLDKIRQYDNTLISYYKNNQVSFSGGIAVDLESTEPTLADQLAKRIYKTRNAIVHSKEGEKSKYIPFEHDKILVKEVPLLRFIAGEIIIRSSSLVS